MYGSPYQLFYNHRITVKFVFWKALNFSKVSIFLIFLISVCLTFSPEVLGALTSVLLIWAMTGILCYLAILRMINEDFEIKSGIMVGYAATGVAMNVL